MRSVKLSGIFLCISLLVLSNCTKEDPPSLTLAPNFINAPAGSGTHSILIKSNTSWSISGLPAYIQASASSGEGETNIVFTFQENASHEERTAEIIVTAKTLQEKIILTQSKSDKNTPPTAPVPISPTSGTTGLNLFPTFTWQASTDADGDKLTYILYYMEGDSGWNQVACEDKTSITLTTPLFGNRSYQWKVVAFDDYYGMANSSVATFVTMASPYREEGEVRVLMGNRPENGVNIVFLCDGFNYEDHLIGGNCDKAAEEALGYFFDIEPYKTYKEYFNVYIAYAHSMDQGASYGAINTVKNTAFSATCDKNSRTNTYMTCDQQKVYTYAQKTPAKELSETLIILVSNDSRYAGTCWMSTDGKAIGITTMSRSNYPYDFRGTVQHEGGGHGFAKLADEYINSETAKDRSRTEIAQRHQIGWYTNVDTDSTNKFQNIRWKHFIGLSKYNAVSTFEGAYYFASGVWRPEAGSCMINNIPYYNAPSREAIVRRIKQILKEEFSFEEFLAKDVTTMPANMPPPPTKLQSYLYLHPPVIVE